MPAWSIRYIDEYTAQDVAAAAFAAQPGISWTLREDDGSCQGGECPNTGNAASQADTGGADGASASVSAASATAGAVASTDNVDPAYVYINCKNGAGGKPEINGMKDYRRCTVMQQQHAQDLAMSICS